MAHYVSRIIRLLLLLAAPLAFATGPLDHPQLPSLETKIEYLLYVNQEVPGLFSDASKYSIDLLDLLDKQGKTAQELHLMPSYAELLKQRPPLRDIEIAPAPKSRVINKDMLLRWRSETLKSLDALASAHPQSAPKAVLLQSVLSNTTPLTRANPSAFLAGLISTLPKEKRAELSALPLEQQIARLERELPAELIGAGFRPAPYGITSATLSRSEALQKLNGLLKNQTNLQPLISILLSSDKPERFPNSWSALKTHIAELPEDEFASLADKQIRRTRIEAWIPSLTVANPSLESDRAMTVMLHEAENRLKRITSESAGAPDLSRPLVLKEMPPSVAIYRGCAGGDCSTSSSWAYPNSPNDRVYLIQDAKGVKGYASGTILKVNGKSTFFLHTIAGPRISSAEARIVIQGLHLARTDLGVKQIALGTPAQINAANNENVIRAEMNASVAGAPEVDTELLDTEVREYLGKKVSNSMYDNPASRAKARIYDPKELLPLTTKGMPSKLEVFVPRGLSKDRAALFVFDLLSRNDGYYPISNSINDIVNLADTRFAVARLKNPLNLSTQDYLKEAKEVLQKIGIPFDDAFLEKNSQYFSKGLMRARDAMAPENQARSLKALISLIKEEK